MKQDQKRFCCAGGYQNMLRPDVFHRGNLLAQFVQTFRRCIEELGVEQTLQTPAECEQFTQRPSRASARSKVKFNCRIGGEFLLQPWSNRKGASFIPDDNV